MATLYNTRISDTYVGLIKTIDNAAISATLRELTDGSGNGTGLSLNNAGDFKVNAILEFGSLKDTGENIVISKFVDAADGIGNNNNDTSIPTTKAIIDYVAGQITAEDLDFRGDDSTVLGDVDLNSQAFIILGTANEIETSVTSAGGNTLQIGIPSNPVLTGIVTATTFSGNLTGNVTGNVTGDLTGNVTATSVLANGVTATTQASSDNSTKVATTAYVKGLDNASDLDFKGDNGTAGDVNLNTQRFDILGTTNQITTVSSGQSLTIGMPTNITISGIVNATTFNGDLNGTINTATTAVTQSAGDNSTKVATTAYVDTLDAASDLDITDGSNTGDVNLNTQSLSILGTSQQVTSTVSNQSVTLSLPSSINVNSASATILQNARDISLTGEASATISSFNGSANVSGAVTLDNDSVTGKVLTGLASPTATNITASDSILQAFGKTQSQLNTLAGGLRFMGTWDATNNTPTLTSGGGESASGTTTGTTANKLVDSSGGFTNAVDGDKVVNQASGATATVTNVDSSTVLSLSADIMVSGQEYTIDNSPYITQGHYFVVSVGGTSSLNGLSNWAVGDWVIAGAGNVWEKLDHTQVDGTGTVGNITKWTSTNVIADSIMAESGSTITATGSIAATQLLSSGGNFSVNTDKFTVNATTGNVAVAGTLDVTSTGIFNDNVSIIKGSAVNLRVTDGTQNIYVGSSSNARFGLGAGASIIQSTGAAFGIGTQDSQALRFGTNNTEVLTLDTSSNATFAGDVSLLDNKILKIGTGNDLTLKHNATDSYIENQTGHLNIVNYADGKDIKFWSDDGSGGIATYFFVDTLSNATQFTKNIYLQDDKKALFGNSSDLQIYHDGSHSYIEETGTGDLRIKSNGASIALLGNSNEDMILAIPDGAVKLYYNNSAKLATTSAGVSVTGALGVANIDMTGILDISATYPRINLNDTNHEDDWSIINADGSFTIYNVDDTVDALKIDSSNNATFAGNLSANVGSFNSPDASESILMNLVANNGNNAATFRTTASGHIFEIRSQNSGTIKIDSSSTTFAGNVGIGDDTPTSKLTVLGTSTAASNTPSDAIVDIQGTSTAHLLMGVANVSPYGAWINTDSTAQPLVLMGTGGNVGIGNRTPEKKLHIFDSTQTNQTIRFGNPLATPLADINYNSSGNEFLTISCKGTTTGFGNIVFETGPTPTERMRIDSSGKMTIKSSGDGLKFDITSSAGSNHSIIEMGQVGSDGYLDVSAAGGGIVSHLSGYTGYASYFLSNVGIGTDSPSAKLEITTLRESGIRLSSSDITAVADELLSGIDFYSPDSGNEGIKASIKVNYADTAANSYMTFSTGANAEKMRITSGGDVEIAPISGSSVIDYGMTLAPQSGYAQIYLRANSTSTTYLQRFYNESSGVLQNVGNITISGSSTNYVTSSDYRLKEDLKDFAGLEKISDIKVYDFKWKDNDNYDEHSKRGYGVLAHELEEVLPQAVNGEKDAEEMQSVDYSKIVPLLVKSIQELKAEVDLLKQECKCK